MDQILEKFREPVKTSKSFLELEEQINELNNKLQKLYNELFKYEEYLKTKKIKFKKEKEETEREIEKLENQIVQIKFEIEKISQGEKTKELQQAYSKYEKIYNESLNNLKELEKQKQEARDARAYGELEKKIEEVTLDKISLQNKMKEIKNSLQ